MEDHLRSFELKRIVQFLLHSMVVMLLTILTQIGGLIYILWLLLCSVLPEKLRKNPYFNVSGFIGFYLIFNLLIIPPLASQFGRKLLPMFECGGLKPATVITCLLNRHYVTVEMESVAFQIARSLQLQEPSCQLIYLDANFPFINGFPLLPHWSHSDGKKLDLAFIYRDKTGRIANDTPTLFGYGSFEAATETEVNTAQTCVQSGYLQYSILKYFILFPTSMDVDEKVTVRLIKMLSTEPSVSKIFIEPHLKTRWGLSSIDKIRFHGCHAVRHDDHIHIQIN